MKAVVLSLVIIMAACSRSTKYTLGEKVTVKKGFNAGCTGVVSNYYGDVFSCGIVSPGQYTITKVTCGIFETGIIWVCQSDVEE